VSTPAARRTTARIWPAAPLRALAVVLGLTAVLWAAQLLGLTTALGGIDPRNVDALGGILWAPLLHGGWAHLVANTAPFVAFGFLATAGGLRRFAAVTALVWLVGGLGVWLTAPDDPDHVGASGVVFGWLAFLLARGFFARSARQVLLAAVLFAGWGGLLLGVLPGQPGVSWQGHLFGALAGVLAARLLARPDRAPTLAA
jgi:membrane associated rhomboid family serine protease